MTAFRLFTIIVIFGVVSVAWMVLGTTIEYRTRDLTDTLSKEVDALWGPSELVQPAPYVGVGRAQRPETSPWADPLKSEIQVDLVHHHRYKGLLWFSTYTVNFSGTYTVGPAEADGQVFVFRFPDRAPFFENLKVALDSQAQEPDAGGAGEARVPLKADGQEHKITVEYQTRGRDRWLYGGAEEGSRIPHLTGFNLTATMNFQEIDYPKGSVSPNTPAEPTADGGAKATWHFDDYRTRQGIVIEMPRHQNAGPIAARMAFFAPVSLFFFFTVLFAVVVLRKVPLHPMHCLFISAGFFAFHILMAYLVDLISIQGAFWICAVTSVFLVVTYMRLVTGARFAIVYVGLAQLVYLIGFSYAFFWEGRTGLTVVVVAIVTLFVLMQATGRLDWNDVFGRPARLMPPGPGLGAPAAARPAQGEAPSAPVGGPQP